MDINKLVLPIFSVGLVAITLYAMYLGQIALAGTALGVIGGVFALPKAVEALAKNMQDAETVVQEDTKTAQ